MQTPPRASRWALVGLLACAPAAACAGAAPHETRHDAPGARLALRLREGERLAITHEERASLAGREVFVRLTRMSLEIRARTPQGSYLVQGRLERVRPDDPARVVATALRFEWLSDGRVRAFPEATCVEDDGELELARFVRFALGSAPLAPQDGRVRAESWLTESDFDAAVRSSRLGEGRVRLDLSGEDRLASADLGAVRLDGSVRVRARFELDAESGVHGEIERRIRGPVRALDRRDGSVSDALLEARITTRITSGELPPRAPAPGSATDLRALTEQAARDEADPCDASGAAIGAGVVQGLAAQRAEIQACYQRELALDAQRSGRVQVNATIASPGHVVGVELVENPLGETLGECVRRAIFAVDAAPGPIAGHETLSFPFVFEPAGS